MAFTYIQSDLDNMNQALRRIGAEPIVDSLATLNGSGATTKGGKVLTAYYPHTVLELLRIFTWNCSVGRAQVTGVGDTTTNFTTKYDLSSLADRVKVLMINGDDNIPYRIEGTNLFCNEPTPISLRYVKNITSDKFDSVLTECLIARLAHKGVFAITGDQSLVQVLFQEFVMDLSLARQVSAVEDHEDLVDIFALYQQVGLAVRHNPVMEQ